MSEEIESPASKMKKLTLKAADEEVFEVDETVAMEFGTIKSYFEDDAVSRDTVVPVPNVLGDSLSRVLKYCKKHVEFRSASSPATEEEIKAFDDEFVNVDNTTLINLIHAANYLNIKHLLEFLCQRVAETIEDMSVEEVRDYFGIENDFTPEEEAEIRSQ